MKCDSGGGGGGGGVGEQYIFKYIIVRRQRSGFSLHRLRKKKKHSLL